ncbi:MAG: hypothetical protein JOZ39_01270 [Chloroflexi bacterium]|nr:hypothetical protein [Chloroflexota bacterium]
MSLSDRDTWLLALLGLSSLVFLAAARWPGRLPDGRALTVGSVGFSIGFVALALLSGLAVLR